MINNQEKIKNALEAARHELTTLHNLKVTDVDDFKYAWTTDTTTTIKLIDEILNESDGN